MTTIDVLSELDMSAWSLVPDSAILDIRSIIGHSGGDLTGRRIGV